MKKVILIICLTFSFLATAQETEPKITFSTTSSLKFSFDNKDELKTINWNDIRDFVKDNKKGDLFSLTFELKKSKKTTNKLSFTVKGESGEIETLIATSKKMINIFNKHKS